MGIPYEDTPEGRSDVSLAAIESAADELGIELVRCTTALNVPPDQSFANLKQCVSKLAKTSDVPHHQLGYAVEPDAGTAPAAH